MKTIFKTHYEIYEGYEKPNTEPSLTVPGQVMTLAEMLIRISSGEEIKKDNRLPYNYNVMEEPEPKVNDLTDLDDIRNEITQTKEKYRKSQEKQEFNKDITKVSETEIKEITPE